MRKYLIFNLIEFFFVGYTSYWDMTFNYKTNLSIQDSIFHSCTFTPLLWFMKVKNIKNTSFKNPQESATSLFYLLTHKYLLQNNLQIRCMYVADKKLFIVINRWRQCSKSNSPKNLSIRKAITHHGVSSALHCTLRHLLTF